MPSVSKKRVGILRGGEGENYLFSLQKGGDIISHIYEKLADKYKPLDILIDTSGEWHLNGVPIKPSDLVHRVDVAWNMSHPQVLNILQTFSIPYVGDSSFLNILQNNKDALRTYMKSVGVDMPKHILLPVYQADFDGPREIYAVKKAKEIFNKFSSPWIVKSFTEDKNMGVHLAQTFPQLIDAIEDGVKHKKSILVEEFIVGKVASVHSVANFRGEDVYAFPVGNVFGSISQEEKEKLINLAKSLHSHMGAKHYLKCTFVLNKRSKPYLLNVDCTPDFRPDSYFSDVCQSAGAEMHHVVEHILEQAL